MRFLTWYGLKNISKLCCFDLTISTLLRSLLAWGCGTTLSKLSELIFVVTHSRGWKIIFIVWHTLCEKFNDGSKSSTWIRHLISPINHTTDLSSWTHFSRIYIHTKTYLELATCCKTRSRWWWSLTRLSSTRSLADANRIFTIGIFIPTKSLTMDG